MAAMDAINERVGRGAIHVGSAVGAGIIRDWSMRQKKLTTQFTTKWSDIPVARARLAQYLLYGLVIKRSRKIARGWAGTSHRGLVCHPIGRV